VLSSHKSICSSLWVAGLVLHGCQSTCRGNMRCQGTQGSEKIPALGEPSALHCSWVPLPRDLPGAFSTCLSSHPSVPRQHKQGRPRVGARCPHLCSSWPVVQWGMQGSKTGSGLALVTSRAWLRQGQGQSVGQGLSQQGPSSGPDMAVADWETGTGYSSYITCGMWRVVTEGPNTTECL